MTASGSGLGSRSISRGDHGPSDRPDARGARGGDAQRGQLAFARRPPAVPAPELRRFRPGTRASRSARRSGPPAGQRESSRPARRCAGPGSREPPARSPSNAPGTRNPGQRATTSRELRIDREVRCDHIRPCAQVEEVFQADEDLAARPASATSRARPTGLFRPAIGLTFSQP